MKKLETEKTGLDHFLVTVGCVLACFAVGSSVGRADVLSWFLAGAVIVASSIGFGLSRLFQNRPILQADAWIWTIFAFASWFLILFLNRLLPGGGFPREIIAASALCWMIILCSLVSWRDQTLLFLSLPCIALFGLVGTFDTYAPATFLFFVFLVCIGVLYARVHQRAMAQRAKLSGENDPDLLARGAWRWMAGPEWALASAFVVILLSLLGAPVIQQSVQGVAGAVQLRMPSPPPPPRAAAASATSSQSDQRIGRGPVSPSETPVFQVLIDRPRLLRQQVFSRYANGGWGITQVNLPDDDILLQNRRTGAVTERGPSGGLQAWPKGIPPAEEIRNPTYLSQNTRSLVGMGRRIPTPGPVAELKDISRTGFFASNGDLILDNDVPAGDIVRLVTVVPSVGPNDSAIARAIPRISDMYTTTEGIPVAVRELADEAIRGAQSDVDKARAIQSFITQRVQYNLRAEPTPAGVDPVVHFLFNSKEGYCDLFASSFVLMARSVGLPARYTIGWLMNDPRTDSYGYYTLREKDYHAWPEVYFEGYGWVAFDPTEGAIEVPGGERGSSVGSNLPFWQQPWFLPVVSGIALLAIVSPAILSFLGWIRSALSRENLLAGELARHHAQFHLGIEDLTKSPKRFSETLAEYVEASASSLATLAPAAHELARRFDDAMFSPRRLDKEGVKGLGKEVAAFREQVSDLRKAKK